MKNAQYLDDTPGQLIRGLVCKGIELAPFSQINNGVIKSGFSVTLQGYNLEGVITGLLEDHDVKKIIKEITNLLTEHEEKDEVLKQIKALIQNTNP